MTVFLPQEDEKNHIFISKKEGTLRPTHTENYCDDIKLYFEERARKKALEMRGEEGKRRSYLNLEERKKERKEFSALVYLFIFLVSFFVRYNALCLALHTHACIK